MSRVEPLREAMPHDARPPGQESLRREYLAQRNEGCPHPMIGWIVLVVGDPGKVAS